MTASRLAVQVHPGARQARLEMRADGTLHVYVSARPEGGKANEELIAALAQALRVGRSRVSIVHGHASRRKVVAVEGLSESDVTSALARRSHR